MKPTVRVPLAIELLTATAAGAAAQVQETIVGPTSTGGAYALAPRGGNVAYAGKKDGRFVVTLNGVEGPAFDELYLTNLGSFFFPERAGVWPAKPGGMAGGGDVPVIASADGAHFAYAGRQGADYVVILDGKEIARGPKEKLARGGGPLSISPLGKHVYWAESEFTNGRTIVRRVIDGKPGPWCQPDGPTWTPVFSADESRVACYLGSLVDTGKPQLTVDGKDAGYVGGNFAFTADGSALLATGLMSSSGSVLEDGKPVATGIQVSKLVTGPTGRRWAAIVR